MSSQALTGQWGEFFSLIKNMYRLMDKNQKIAAKKKSQYLRDKMKQTILDGRPEWPKLKKATIKAKGSSKILIDQADMFNSINAINMEDFESFVGVPANVENSDGTKLVNIAVVHEAGSLDGTIPQRSFIDTTFNDEIHNLAKFHVDAADAALKGKGYRPHG